MLQVYAAHVKDELLRVPKFMSPLYFSRHLCMQELSHVVIVNYLDPQFLNKSTLTKLTNILKWQTKRNLCARKLFHGFFFQLNVLPN